MITRVLSDLAVHGKAGAAVGLEIDRFRVHWGRPFPPVRKAVPSTASRELYRRLWIDAAARIGATVTNDVDALLVVQRDGASIRLWDRLLPVDDPVTLRLAGDKPAVHELLRSHGFRVPRYLVSSVLDCAAAAAFVTAHRPCVVKPAVGSGAGDGVTGYVSSTDDLLRARLRAARFDPDRLLVEEQVDGQEYRILVFDGQALGALRRRPPVLHGDGRSTVASLVAGENRRRLAAHGTAGLRLLHLDLDMALTLRHQDLTLRSVPRAGAAFVCGSCASTGSERDATAVAVSEPSVERLTEVAREAARVVGARLASVELIAAACEEGSARDDPLVVLEINTTPGIAQHYITDDATSREPVAERLLDQLLASSPLAVS